MTSKEEIQELNKDFIEFSSKVDEFIDTFGERLNSAAKGFNEEQTAGLWKPKEGEGYYYIGDSGLINYDTWNNDSVDIARYDIGNVFKSYNQGEKVRNHLKVETQLRDIAARLNRGREIDWTDDFDKYYLVVNCYTNLIDWSSDRRFKGQGVIYCLDENFKDIAIQEIGEDRLTEYLKS